jgi:hypothetical protein
MGYGVDFVRPEVVADALAAHGVAQPYEELRESDDLIWNRIEGPLQDRFPGSSVEIDADSRAIRHGATGISVTVRPGLLYLEVPFWNMDEWPLMIHFLRRLAREIEETTGTVACDAAEEDRFVQDHISDLEPDGLTDFLATRSLRLPD